MIDVLGLNPLPTEIEYVPLISQCSQCLQVLVALACCSHFNNTRTELGPQPYGWPRKIQGSLGLLTGVLRCGFRLRMELRGLHGAYAPRSFAGASFHY